MGRRVDMGSSRRVSLGDLKSTHDVYMETRSARVTAARLGISRNAVRNRLVRYAEILEEGKGCGVIEGGEPQEVSGHRVEKHFTGDKGEVVTYGFCRTIEDALEKGEIDLDVWEPARSVVNHWEVGAKGPDGQVVKTPLWQVKVWLQRRKPSLLAEAMEVFVERLSERQIPAYEFRPPETRGEPMMLEVDLPDHHFGKYAWGRELDGDNWDLRIARMAYLDAGAELVRRARLQSPNITKVLIVLGNDYFHVSSEENTTRKGTRQDVDGRIKKMIATGALAFIQFVESLLPFAEIEIKWIEDNHGPLICYQLCREIAAYFRECPSVTVDIEPTPRKYCKFGSTLIGFAHGDEEKESDMPLIMMDSNPQDYADAIFHEVHLGHHHKKKAISYLTVDTRGSTTVRRLMSLTPKDYWHYKKGYNSPRGAEGFLYGVETGPAGYVQINMVNNRILKYGGRS